MQASMLPSQLTAQQSNHLTEKAKTCVLVFFIATFHVPGKYTLHIKFPACRNRHRWISNDRISKTNQKYPPV